MKRIFLWVGVIAVIGLVLIGLGRLATKTDKAEGDLATPVTAADIFKGSATAPVTIVEYSDFQCPACASYAPMLSRLIAARGDEVRLVYRHFPLQQHQYAQFAGLVAEAAGRQGKFWEMHDLIFANQTEWSNSPNATGLMLSYIQTLGLDLTKFQVDVADKELKAKVQNDYKSGVKSGVKGTPTLFVNGKMIQNPRSYEELSAIVDAALSKNNATTTVTTSTATSS